MKKAFWNVGVRIQKSAFTLVELIVVIIILAILATIAFAVYEGYTSDARDSKKMEEVSLLHKGLSVAFIKSSKYPEETSMSTIASGSTVLAKQSPVGKTIASFIGVSSDIFSTGSSNSTDYTYTLNSLRSKAQVSVFLEKQKDVTIAVQTGSITKYLFTKGDSIPLLLASDTYEPLGTSGSSTTIDVSSATTPVTAIAGVSSTWALVTYSSSTDLLANLPTLYASGYISTSSGGSDPVIPPAFICGTSTVTGRSPDTTVYQTVTGADGKCWLASNLGTNKVATAYDDSTAYGWYYQWGRLTDEHQITTSSLSSTQSTSDIPGHASFITGFFDWRTPKNDALSTTWGGVNGTSSPCPIDWRIPTQAEWASLVTAAGITNSATAFNSSLKLTVAGFRNISDGSLYFQESSGYYWSSSPKSTYAYAMYFDSMYVSPANLNNRAYGFSVRCLKN